MLHVHTDSRYCNSRKKNGERCRQPAGAGTDHLTVGQCRLHGGMMAPTRLHGARVLADRKARAALQSMAVPVQMHPQEALLAMVWEAAGNVAWLGSRVQALAAGDGDRAGQSGVVGGVMSSTVQGSLYEAREEERAIVRLYGEWVDRLAKISKMALDAGIEERTVRVAEEMGTFIVATVNRVLVRIGTPKDKIIEARSLLAAEFRAVRDPATLT